jgi:hypothetical protein
VERSATAGTSGAISPTPIVKNGLAFWSRFLPFDESKSIFLNLLEKRTGKSEIDSTPPATTTSESPDNMLSTAHIKACIAEAHALVTVKAGTVAGIPELSAISLARFEVFMEGRTVPKITLSISPGSISVLFTSSTVTIFPRSKDVSPLKSVPDFMKGVLRP